MLGHTTSYTYDGDGNLTAEVDANNHRTEYSYNALDQRTAILFDDASTRGESFDALSRRTGQADQAGLQTQRKLPLQVDWPIASAFWR